jgi:hypothetical protein
MARPSLFTHRKFAALGARFGSQITAAGVLELLWHRAYNDGDPVLGFPEAIEFAIGWQGEPGECVSALLDVGFLETTADGLLAVHDLFDHAPNYVRKRRAREIARKNTTTNHQTADSDRSLSGQRPPNGNTPAPAPAPAPIEDLRDVGDDDPRQTRPKVNGAKRRTSKPKPENREAQRLIMLYRGAVHEKRGLTPGVSMRKDTIRMAGMAKARPELENEGIVLAFAESPPKVNGTEVTQNIGALLGFAEAAAATPAYRDAKRFLETAEGRLTVDRLVELGRSLKGVTA